MFRTIRGCVGLVAICFALMAHAQDFEAVKQAAERGDVVAQFDLGLMYATGRGVEQSNAEATKWFRKAGKQENVEAQRETLE